MKAIERLFMFFEAQGLKHTPVEKELGLTNGYLGKMRNRNGSIGSDILETIFCKFQELNPNWVLTGRGSMLINDLDQSLPQQQSNSELTPSEASLIYKMYQDEKHEKEKMLKEKELKIEELNQRIIELSTELARICPEGLDTAKSASIKNPLSKKTQSVHSGSVG